MRRDERGVVAVIVAIVIALLLGFVALSVETGHMLTARGELQNGADAAALAGVRRLNGTNDNGELDLARSTAENYARAHPTDRWDVEPYTVDLGAWVGPDVACSDVGGTETPLLERYATPDEYKFCSIPPSDENAANITAVRTVTSRRGAPGNAGGGAIERPFGGAVQHPEPKVLDAEAIAVSGGPCRQDCPRMPLVIRRGCLFEGGQLRCNNELGELYYIGLSPQMTDTAGLIGLSPEHGTHEAAYDMASGQGACNLLKAGESCTPLPSNTVLPTQNGNDINNPCMQGCSARAYWRWDGTPHPDATATTCEAIRGMADKNCDGMVDLDENGEPAKFQFPVVQYDDEAPSFCGPAAYNNEGRIVGFATAAIVSVRCEGYSGGGENQLPLNPQVGSKPITALCDAKINEGYSASNCIVIRVYCDQEDPEPAPVGCGWFGTGSPNVVLVR